MSSKIKPARDLLHDYHLLSFDTLDSTNEEAKRLARAGGGHGAVIWAKKQTAGKGRLGREWMSEEGNLFVSILVRPQKPLPELSHLSFVTACAAHETLAGILPKECELACKWPNDVLLENRKVGGILLESFQTDDDASPWVVIGVGINVDSAPENTAFPASCLKDAGVELISAKIVLSRFIHHFIEHYNEWNEKGFTETRDHWLRHAWGMGAAISVRLPDKTLEGIHDGIDPHGNLILLLPGDKRQYIQAADIVMQDAAGRATAKRKKKKKDVAES